MNGPSWDYGNGINLLHRKLSWKLKLHENYLVFSFSLVQSINHLKSHFFTAPSKHFQGYFEKKGRTSVVAVCSNFKMQDTNQRVLVLDLEERQTEMQGSQQTFLLQLPASGSSSARKCLKCATRLQIKSDINEMPLFSSESMI